MDQTGLESPQLMTSACLDTKLALPLTGEMEMPQASAGTEQVLGGPA